MRPVATLEPRSRFTPLGRKHARYELATKYADQPGFVPYEPVRDHLMELRQMGLPARSIARDAGCPEEYVIRVCNGHRATLRIRHATALRAVTHKPNPRQERVLAVGAVRRLRALHTIGHTWRALADRSPLSAAWISMIARDTATLLTYDDWHAISELYEQLSGTPGPSVRARNKGRRNGWGAPLDWEGLDIDDPRMIVIPSGPPKPPTLREGARQRRAEVARLSDKGWTAERIAEHLGITPRSVQRMRAENACKPPTAFDLANTGITHL